MNGRLIITIAAVFLLISGLVGGVYVTQKQTQLLPRAAEETGPNCSLAYDGKSLTTTETSQAREAYCNGSSDPAACTQDQISAWIAAHNTALMGQYPPVEARDKQTLYTQTCRNIYDFYTAYLPQGKNPAQEWANAHNAALPPAPSPTSPPAGGDGTTAGTGQITNMTPPGNPDYSGSGWNWNTITIFTTTSNTTYPKLMWIDKACNKNDCGNIGWTFISNVTSGSTSTQWTNPVVQPGQTVTIGLIDGDNTILDTKQKAFPVVTVPTPSPTATVPPGGATGLEGGTCQLQVLDTGLRPINTDANSPNPIVSEQPYIFELIFTNTGTTSWNKDSYKMMATGDTTSNWGFNKSSIGTSDPEFYSPGSTISGSNLTKAVFRIPVKAKKFNQTVPAATGPSYRFIMTNGQNSTAIGADCNGRFSVLVPGTNAAGAADATQVQYIMAVGDTPPNAANNLNTATPELYDPGSASGSKKVSPNFGFTDTEKVKVVAVQFIKTVNGTATRSQIFYSKPLTYKGAGPSISNVDCHQAVSGSGTVINITGSNFGSKGTKSKVTIKGKNVAVSEWKEASITINMDELLSGENEVEVTTDNGTSDKNICVLGVTTAQVVVKNVCNLSVTNLDADVNIFANIPADATPDPLVSQKVKIDKDGKLTSFAPKLEKSKKYSVVVKAPKMIARKVDFDATGGTKKIEVTLPIGDIAPVGGDGVINANDIRKLYSEWNLINTVTKESDLNGDGRVNSFDYTCLVKKGNYNERDEEFAAPPSPTPTATTTPTESPTQTVSPTP